MQPKDPKTGKFIAIPSLMRPKPLQFPGVRPSIPRPDADTLNLPTPSEDMSRIEAIQKARAPQGDLERGDRVRLARKKYIAPIAPVQGKKYDFVEPKYREE